VTLTAPTALDACHDVAGFASGVPSLDEWLRRRAAANQASGASRTFVVCTGEGRVVGYYALAAGAVHTNAVGGRFRRNMPDPIPVVILARLAVDTTQQGQGLGRALFRDAARRVLGAADAIGIRGIVVHAISNDARAFYEALGFGPTPLDPMTLAVTLNDLRGTV
jgi:predicted N-acetyltransferase YhbS